LAGQLVGRLLNRGNRATIIAAAAALPVPPDAVLADVGFGGGLGLGLLLQRLEHTGQGGRVYGIDVSTTMLAAAQRRFRRQITSGRLQLHHASIERLPLPDGVLDGAMTLNTIYFLPDLHPALAELRRVLKHTGLLVLGLGDPQAMARMPVTQHGFRLRPVSDVIDALRQAGLTLREHRRVGDTDDAYHLLVTAPA
jgi:ubiquinone/menaquinone biosynthesis C-methylase UbiE